MCLHLVFPVPFPVSHSDCRRSSYIYDVANNYCFPYLTTAFRGWPETSASGLVYTIYIDHNIVHKLIIFTLFLGGNVANPFLRRSGRVTSFHRLCMDWFVVE